MNTDTNIAPYMSAFVPASQGAVRFKRNDLQVFGTTERNTLRVLPLGKKKRQNVVVGDHNGSVSLFSVGKNHECNLEFQTSVLAKEANASPREGGSKVISAIDLYEDQIFVAFGGKIQAYTKKGKPFFTLETSLNEPINHLKINTPLIFIGGEFMQTNFKETQELGFFMAPDKINALQIGNMAAGTDNPEAGCYAFLGCQDRTVRSCLKQEVLHTANCEAPVTSMVWSKKHGEQQKPKEEPKDLLVYGTQRGSIGALAVNYDDNASLNRKFIATPSGQLAPVSALTVADFTKDGCVDVAVAREDGGIELHSFEQNPDGVPVRVWRGELRENITSLGHGAVTAPDRQELVVCTYSGRVLSLVPNEGEETLPDVMSGPVASVANITAVSTAGSDSAEKKQAAEEIAVTKAKVQETEAEVQNLKEMLRKKLKSYQKAQAEIKGTSPAPASPKGVATSSAAVKAVTSTFTVRDKIFLDEDSSSVVVVVEIDQPLECVALSTNLQVEMLESQADDALQFTQTPADVYMNNGSKAKVQALYKGVSGSSKNSSPRDNASTYRLEIRFRPKENGEHGDVNIFVTASGTPKTCQQRSLYVPPLALHSRLIDEQQALLTREADPTLSKLILSGAFTQKQMHVWLYKCLFDIPEVFNPNAANEGPIEMVYRHTYVGTLLYISYEEGKATFHSQNISTLVLIKNFVGKEATTSKVTLSTIDLQVLPPSVACMLDFLHPLLEKWTGLTRSEALLPALREIEQQESDAASFLSDDYLAILNGAKGMESDLKEHTARIDFLRDILVRLMTDVAMHIGQSVTSSQLELLEHIISKNYSRDSLIDCFNHI